MRQLGRELKTMEGALGKQRMIVAFSLACAMPVSAQEYDCSDRSELPQQGINFCLGQDHAFWDNILNNAYQQVIAIRDPVAEERLREAQRAWITYRDATCEMEADRMRGGSGEQMLRFGCLARLTERRARDLENYLQH